MTLLDSAGVAGAVLIGGASRRMGESKMLIRVPEYGPTMLERVVAAMRCCCSEVALVGPPRAEVPAELARIGRVEDAGEGPVGGLIAALRATDRSWLFLSGCDIPFLSGDVVAHVIGRALETGRGVVPVVTGNDGVEQLQPLHAVYHQHQLAAIERAFNEGERSLVDVVGRLDVERLRIDASTVGAPGMWAFFNVNTPADLEVARRHAGQEL